MPYSDPEKQRAANAASKRKRRERAKTAAIKEQAAKSDGPTSLRSLDNVLAAFERAAAAIEDPAVVIIDPIAYARQLTATASAAGKLLAERDLEKRIEMLEDLMNDSK